jgi:hypothetical protein
MTSFYEAPVILPGKAAQPDGNTTGWLLLQRDPGVPSREGAQNIATAGFTKVFLQ